MWLLVYVPAVFGILRHRHWPYWRWVMAMLIWQSAAQFLFDARGSLEHPEGDGLIMRAVRQATSDGPETLLVGVPFLIVFWGGIFYFGRQLYLASKAPNLGSTTVKPVSGLRKGAELVVLTMLAAVMLYSNLIASRTLETGGATRLEEQIDRTVAAVDAVAPLKIDNATVLMGAAREGLILVYDYKVSDPTITSEVAAAFLKEGIAKPICASEDNRAVLDGGGTLRLRYALATGGKPIVRDVHAADCLGP